MRKIPASWLAAASLAALASTTIPREARAQGAVAFAPQVGSIPDGVGLGVVPAVSADRRYVRLSLDVGFSTIDGFSNFPVPGAVSGGGANRGGLGGGGLGGLLGGGGGGAAGGGAGAGGNAAGGGMGVVSGMNGPVAPGMPATAAASNGYGYGYGYGSGSSPSSGYNLAGPTGYDPFLSHMATTRPAPAARRTKVARPKPAPAAKKSATPRAAQASKAPAPAAVPIRDARPAGG